LGALGIAAWPAIAGAQSGTGSLLVTVVRLRDSVPIAGAFVRPSSRTGSAVTNSVGLARLELEARLWSIAVAHPGHKTATFEMTIVPNVAQSATIYLADADGHPAAPYQVTKLAVPAESEPLPVVFLDDPAIIRALQRRPGDLLGLFPGGAARLQAVGGALDATRLQIHGLPGHYTGLLVDGAPLQAGRSGLFGLLQTAPTDLAAIELILGTATALHGPAAASGAVNLVSRGPDRDRVRIGLDQSSEKGGDAFFWGARRFSPTTAGTLAVDFHQQRLVDADDDQWGEFPRAIRLSIRPRVVVDRPSGDGMTATAGFSSEDRTGGFLTAINDPNPYREERRTARGDLAIAAHRLVTGGRVDARVSGAIQSTSHRFDDLRERDNRYAAFAELSYARAVGPATAVAGASLTYEALRQDDFPAFDYNHSFPSVFGRVLVPLGSGVTGSLSGRCDQHNLHGLQCMPRVSLLARGESGFEGRMSVGEGYYAPTPLTDEVETIGLHGTVPVAARAERVRSASLNARYRRDGWMLDAAIQYARVASPVRLVPVANDPAGRLRLLNLSEPTRVFGGEFAASYLAETTALRVYYAIVSGSEGDLSGIGRRDLTLTPKHSFGASILWRPEIAGQPIASLETGYTGPQSLIDNPYLDRTPGYLVVNGLASLRSGRARLYLNGENLTDRKLRNYHAVLLPAPGAGGRRTVAPWAPLRGRVISIGAVVDW